MRILNIDIDDKLILVVETANDVSTDSIYFFTLNDKQIPFRVDKIKYSIETDTFNATLISMGKNNLNGVRIRDIKDKQLIEITDENTKQQVRIGTLNM